MTEDEKLNERLSRFSDRQIVVETLGLLTQKQIRRLVTELERNY